MGERIDIVKRFGELFPNSWPFDSGPFRAIPYNEQIGYDLGANLIVWDDYTQSIMVKAKPHFVIARNARERKSLFGNANSWTKVDETDSKLQEFYDGFQKRINQIIIKLLMSAAINRTDASFTHSSTLISVSEMMKRYNICCLCTPNDFDPDIDIPTYKFNDLKCCIGLSVPDISRPPFVIHYKNLNICRDNTVGINTLGIYGYLECALVIYNSDRVYLSRCSQD